MMFRAATAFAFLALAQSPAFAAPPSPETNSCVAAKDVAYCLKQRKQFLAAWPKANTGDYHAQRTIAFCLLSGCSEAVKINQKDACTWATVIVSTKESDASDAANYRESCRSLAANDRTAATSAAMISYGKIYKKLMTKTLPYEAPLKP